MRRRRRRSATERLRPVRLSKRPHLVLRPRAWLTCNGRGLPAERIPFRSSIRVWRLWRRVDIGDPSPAVGSGHWARAGAVWLLRLLWSRAGPLRTRRSNSSLILVGLRVHIGRRWRLRWLTIGTAVTQQLQPGLDMRVGRVKFSSTLVCIQRIADLVVATFVLYNAKSVDRTSRAIQLSE